MHPYFTGLRLPAASAPQPGPLPPQPKLMIPLQWGETALVRVGEIVRAGQRIADGAGDTVPVHTGVSGRVTAIAPRTCADGRRHPVVVVESDGRAEADPSICRRALADGLSDELLLAILYEAGLRLPGGPPLATVVADAARSLRLLVVSAMDEPWLHAENAAFVWDGEAVLSGIRLLERLIRPEMTVLAVGARQRAAIRAAAAWTGPRLRLALLPDRYPTFHPDRLAALLGDGDRRGVLVLPATAAAACGRAVYDGWPVTGRTVSVDWGEGRALFTAPIGTPLRALLKAAGQRADRAVLGGPMTGVLLRDPGAPVTADLAGLTIPPETAERPQTPCIRCGRCAAVCPVGLRPYLTQRRRSRAEWTGCLRCGACEFSCPAGLPLLRAMAGRRKEAVTLD